MGTLTTTEKLSIVEAYIEASDIPIQMVPLARRLGIRVYMTDWPNSISGKIERDEEKGGDSGFACYVNKSHPAVRRRFTIAHEISHYILHEHQIGDGIFDDAKYRSGLPETAEYEANRMAANLLMPMPMVKAAKKLVGLDPAKLAEMFWVSEAAMRIRLGLPYEPATSEAQNAEVV